MEGGAIVALHHVGVTVSDLDRSVGFYQLLFRTEPTLRRRYHDEYISRLFGYDSMEIEVAFFDVPRVDAVLELIEFHHPPSAHVDTAQRCVGSTHLGLLVPNLNEEVERLRSSGAAFRSNAPVDIPAGPFVGWRTIFVLDPDRVSVQLMEAPRGVAHGRDEDVAWTA